MQVGGSRGTAASRRAVVALATAGLVAGVAACGGDGNPSREDVLDAITEDVIVPTYGVVADRTAALAVDVRDACDDRGDDEALARARGAWSLLWGTWMETKAYRFGPAMNDPTLTTIELPADIVAIDRVLAGTTILHDESVAALDPDQRNLRAVEYLLHRDDQLTFRTCDYLEPATELLANAAAVVLAEWVGVDDEDDDVRPFGDQFVHPGDGGAFATEQEAIDEIVNGMIATLGEVAAKIGYVSGDTTGQVSLRTADPGLAQRGRRDTIDMIVGVRRLYEVSNGLRDAVEPVSDKTAEQLSDDLDDAIDAIKELPQPLAIATRRAPAHDAYVAVRAAEATLREIATLLGVTVAAA